MEELPKLRKDTAKYFVEPARGPEPFDHVDQDTLLALVTQKYQQPIHTPFLITNHSSMERGL